MYVKVYQYSERGQINATNDCNTSSIKKIIEHDTSRPEWPSGYEHQF